MNKEQKMVNEDKALEANILLGLFKATVEQSTYLNNELKQKPKQVFNQWQKQGFKLLDELEKRNQVNIEYLENLTDIIHNVVLEVRKQSKK
jgi:hypothetical protein